MYIEKLRKLSLPNKYTNWYISIISNAVLRASTRETAKTLLGENIEGHHILPKSFKLGGEKDKLFPTELGEIVNKFLLDNFESILEYDFTAYVEDELDKVAKGKNKWHKIVDETYQKIKPKLEFWSLISPNSSQLQVIKVLAVVTSTARIRVTICEKYQIK